MQDKIMKGYILLISENNSAKELRGTYIKKTKDGIIPQDVAKEELTIFELLPNISNNLHNGQILQIHEQYDKLHAQIGEKLTEGPYCETEYMKVIEEIEDYFISNLLVNLDILIATKNNSKQEKMYRKAYKGEIRYE